MINKITYLLIVSVVLLGCYPAHTPTYPTLDGTYILREVVVNETDILNSELNNDIYDDPMTFVYPNPIGPLDTLKINKSRISISGHKLYAGYYLQNGGDHWRENYNINITQDFVTGRWINLNVEYNTPSLNTYRHYLILEDGLEYLVLECPKQYTNAPEGSEYSYVLTFYREGP
ncbi:hypothetical protein EB155_06210 [archaeon]|nr:hypothetical protein [archaeon]NDB79442.1 hypothetical protein [archaeon]